MSIVSVYSDLLFNLIINVNYHGCLKNKKILLFILQTYYNPAEQIRLD